MRNTSGGKGSAARPLFVNDDVFAANFDRIFGKKEKQLTEQIPFENKSNLMPFLFARFNKNVKVSSDNINSWVVIISEPVFEQGFDSIEEYKNCLIIPENNIKDKQNEKTFATIEEARAFIKKWWATTQI